MSFLAAALCAVLREELAVVKVELAESRIGAPRLEMRVHPLENAFLRFTVAGLKTGDDGQRKMTFSYTLRDSGGTALMKEVKGEASGEDALPVSPGVVWCNFRLTAEVKGPVTLSLRIRDEVAGKEVTKDVKVDLSPAEAAIVGARFTADPGGETPRAPVFVVGEQAVAHYDVVALKVKEGTIWYRQDLEIVEAGTGKRVYLKEKLFDYRPGEAQPVVSAHHSVMCSRPGRFVFRIVGWDMNDGGRKIERSLPFEVREP